MTYPLLASRTMGYHFGPCSNPPPFSATLVQRSNKKQGKDCEGENDKKIKGEALLLPSKSVPPLFPSHLGSTPLNSSFPASSFLLSFSSLPFLINFHLLIILTATTSFTVSFIITTTVLTKEFIWKYTRRQDAFLFVLRGNSNKNTSNYLQVSVVLLLTRYFTTCKHRYLSAPSLLSFTLSEVLNTPTSQQR